jgi:hypothetical protein
MTEVVPIREIVDVRTGELLPATPENASRALQAIREMEGLLRDAKALATAVLVDEARRQGTKTLRVGGRTVTVKESREIVWDMEQLEKLRDLGLPESRWAELVTEVLSYKVSAQVAKELSGANPEYAEIIERARTDYVRTSYASVK